MKLPQILYGKHEDEIVHIDEVESGRACQSTCLECGRPLVAKKGEMLAHHFAHDTDDINCNPSSESLVHSYAKQQASKLKELLLPGFTVMATVKSTDGETHELHRRYHPHYRLKVRSSEVEADLGTIQPDVLFVTEYGKVAFEVFFRHQVPPEKIEKLKHHYLSTIEVDLSDLSVDSSSNAINQAIADNRRWKWLHNQHITYIQGEMTSMLARSTRIFVPGPVDRIPNTSFIKVPSKKLARADKLSFRAKRFIEELRQLPPITRTQRVLSLLETELRIAIHCELIGIKPTKLPLHLMQSIRGQAALGMHPVVWQTGVFAKYCVTGREFTAKEAEQWVRSTIKDDAFDSALNITQTINGFSPVAEGIYHFLRNLSAQGLLLEIEDRKPWESRFKPLYDTKAEVLNTLISHPSALTASSIGSPT